MTFEERAKREAIVSEEMQHKTMIDEVKLMKKMKEEIDLEKIEMTAMNLVKENIERAVSVADEIKKEMDAEMSEHIGSFDTKALNIESETTNVTNISSQKTTNEASELVQLIDKTTEHIISYNENKSEVNVAKEVEKIEINKYNEQDVSVTERKLSAKRDIEESIDSGSVRRKSEIFDNKVASKTVEQQFDKKTIADKQALKSITALNCKSEETRKSEVSKSTEKANEVKTESVSSSQNAKVKSDSKTSKHTAYRIGLQTIPNIKGTIHSSYHYNLLLKTFFIHLTDVMVALSRFILTEPVFDKDLNDEKELIKSETETEYVSAESVNSTITQKQKECKDAEVHEDNVNEKIIVNKKHEQNKLKTEEIVETEEIIHNEECNGIENVRSNSLEYEDATEARIITGAKMAQLTARKSEELTLKMGAVISEFETKAGIELSSEARERRSRSRSRIEEEVAKESDPLEWLSKVDKQTQEITEVRSESKSHSAVSESVEQKRAETTERREKTCSETKSGNQMYVAIVESHVFTNKDAIFEEQIERLSEKTFVQSADEVKIAVQANETIFTENVALESNQIKKEVVESILEDSRELEIVNAKNETVEIIQDINSVLEAEKVKTFQVTQKPAKNITIQEIIEPSVEALAERRVQINDQKLLIIEEEQVQENNIKLDIEEEKHSIDVREEAEISIEKSSHAIVQEKHHAEQSIITENSCSEVTEENNKEEVKEVEIKELVEVIPEMNIVRPTKLNLSKVEASSELKMIKEHVLEVENTMQCIDESELTTNKSETELIQIENNHSTYQNLIAESYISNEIIQEASFTAKTSEQSKKLTLQIDLADQRRLESQNSETSGPPSTIDTPTPATIPPTPLTDEYVFKLQIPLPKNVGTPIPRDCTPTPEDEDPHIVKKKLIAHIDTTLDSPIIYDPPLPSPPLNKVQSPVYTKPGLRGGCERRGYSKRGFEKKEEILEIERKSSLLASAIDETIKCIEEYKEEVGIDTKTEIEPEGFSIIENTVPKTTKDHKTAKQETNIESQPIIYNGYAKIENKVYNSVETNDTKMENDWNHIEEQVKNNNENLSELSMPFNEEKKDREQQPAMNGLLESVAITKSKKSVVPEELTEKLPNGIEINEPNDISASFDIKVCSEVKPGDVIETVPAAYKIEEKKDPLEGYRPIQFNPEELKQTKKNLQSVHLSIQAQAERSTSPSYVDASGQLLGTHQGIVDGLKKAVVDAEVANELGKPGMTEEKIAELISGESEMLREAHVMGLSRVLKSHMHRADDDSSVDFKKIKPIIESLKDSEVLKALNEEVLRVQEEKKKEEQKKWTTFLQKPQRPVPRVKFGYYGFIEPEQKVEEPYKVKIVKQPKPKVAPDYKPEDFETGPLPWEERALKEPPPPPVDPEDPILVPEEVPEFLEAVDPLPESEVPDLEETGIPLPTPKVEEEEPSTAIPESENPEDEDTEDQPETVDIEAVVEETERIVEEMEQNKLAEQLLSGVQNMVDPNATVEQQLVQMRAQLAALAQLPVVIQNTLELVTRQLTNLSHQETQQLSITERQMETTVESQERIEETEIRTNGIVEEVEEQENVSEQLVNSATIDVEEERPEEETKPTMTEEEREKLKKEEREMLEEQQRIEKQKKELMEQMRLEQESRQVKQRPTPRVGKPKPVFGPPVPVDRPLVLPGGRRWRKPQDAYNEQFIAETLTAQAEIIQGKAKGINFMKYEKPPVSLDHLQQSETYKLIHNMEQVPAKRVEMLTPVIAEADYREKCRSVTPALGVGNHMP